MHDGHGDGDGDGDGVGDGDGDVVGDGNGKHISMFYCVCVCVCVCVLYGDIASLHLDDGESSSTNGVNVKFCSKMKSCSHDGEDGDIAGIDC